MFCFLDKHIKFSCTRISYGWDMGDVVQGDAFWHSWSTCHWFYFVDKHTKFSFIRISYGECVHDMVSGDAFWHSWSTCHWGGHASQLQWLHMDSSRNRYAYIYAYMLCIHICVYGTRTCMRTCAYVCVYMPCLTACKCGCIHVQVLHRRYISCTMNMHDQHTNTYTCVYSTLTRLCVH